MPRPDSSALTGQDTNVVPMSLQRIAEHTSSGDSLWIGPDEASDLTPEEQTQYDLAHTIQRHLCIQAPLQHKSGHPGGPLSAFTACYTVNKYRDSSVDQPLRMSPED